jgi:hypothetical protein
MSDYFGLAVNLGNIAPSQYANYNFNSMVQFNGAFFAAGDDGLFSLDDAETDDGTYIDSWFKPRPFDLVGRLHSAHVFGEFDGVFHVAVKCNEAPEILYIGDPALVNQKQGRVRVRLSKRPRGTQWDLKFRNIDGRDFSVDKIHVYPMRLAGLKNQGP